ncbi:MAG: hypothetical protein GAK43_02707 [Stenotrophomonas maltophilia]|nr:MAG: hypothetical protein GAK43_02707 [Stenotrophomonas maltophilia]
MKRKISDGGRPKPGNAMPSEDGGSDQARRDLQRVFSVCMMNLLCSRLREGAHGRPWQHRVQYAGLCGVARYAELVAQLSGQGIDMDRRLSQAVRAGDVVQFKKLYLPGTTIEARSKLLCAAVSAQKAEVSIVRFLLNEGTPIEAVARPEANGRFSALQFAALYGSFDVLRLLLDRGADDSGLGWDSIFRAVVFGSLETLDAALNASPAESGKDCWARSITW